MKMAKKRRLVNESIDCYEKDKTQTVLDPMTAHAIAYSERKDKLAQEAMKDKGKEFDGGPKQPHPEKVEVPKPLLDESLFESYCESNNAGCLKEGKSYKEASMSEIADWLAYHENAWRDAVAYFNCQPNLDDFNGDEEEAANAEWEEFCNTVTKDELIDWIRSHKQLSKDFDQYFSDLSESLNESGYEEDRVVQFSLDIAETEDCSDDIEDMIQEISEGLGYTVCGISNDYGWTIDEYRDYLSRSQRMRYEHVSQYSVDVAVGVDQEDFPLDTLVSKLNDASGKFEVVGSDFTDTSWSFKEYGLKESMNLTEKAWTYNLKCGKALRDAIEAEDYEELKTQLLAAWHELEAKFPDDVYDSDWEDIEILDTEPSDDYDVTQEDIEDNFNYELSNLYDFCDAMNVWIPLD